MPLFTRRKKQAEDEGGGAPEWMVTFSDCMTLLLTFFVLLLSFSTFDEEVFRRVRDPFAESIQSGGLSTIRRSRDAVIEPLQLRSSENPVDGSEQYDPESSEDSEQADSGDPADFRDRKVFISPSSDLFWGEGTVISSQGREILDLLALYLEHTTNRVLISENGPGGVPDKKGLDRSLEILSYLTEQKELADERFSIAFSSTLDPYDPDTESLQRQRRLEIVLLERSLH